jgi:hypothetical protein
VPGVRSQRREEGGRCRSIKEHGDVKGGVVKGARRRRRRRSQRREEGAVVKGAQRR